VATKVCCYYDEGLGIEYVSYQPDAAKRSVERSLRLLGRERLDIVYVHDPAEENLRLVFREGGVVDVLARLQEQGLVRKIGMASWDPRSLRAAIGHGAFDVIQSFHVNTLLNRSGRDELFPLAEAKGMGICDSGPYAGYVRATGAAEGARYNYAPAPPEVLAAVRRIEAICARRGVQLADAALAYSLREPLVDVVVAASGDPEHIASWARALATPLTEEDFREMIDAAGPDHDVFDSKVAKIQLHLW
jgi:D-threo-aldose 1-dehydrogenase